MNVKERIFHAVLFELGALIVAGAAVLLGGSDGHTAIGLAAAMAIVAMAANFGFNWVFDKIFTGKREERGALFRLFHTVSFETVLLLATVPMIAYTLKLSLWHALLADIALTLIIMGYAFVFNWLYDHARLKFVRQEA